MSHMSYLSRHDYFSYPGLTEESTMHLWCQCLWILIAASSKVKQNFARYKGLILQYSTYTKPNYRDVK